MQALRLRGTRPGRSAIILAGGNSSRMGEDKALLRFEGRPLLCWTIEKLALSAGEVVVVAKDEQHAKQLFGLSRTSGAAFGDHSREPEEQDNGVVFTWDSQSGYGPVAGLCAGLCKASGVYVFATGCDLPFLKPKVVDRIFELAEGHQSLDAVVPVQSNGFYEPLHSVYRREKMLAACRRALENEERRIYGPLRELQVKCVPIGCFRSIDPELMTFFNLNTQKDLETAR
ncbi:MAG: molybdenum cofactor guanylyltransferase, partial [Methanothrix sp.]|nr:molybdenum cofactor guanylyltransferase [Methanothrix sp.]